MRKTYPTHIFKEESKEIWALCTSSLSAMAISARMKKTNKELRAMLVGVG